MNRIEIKSWVDGAVLFSHECENNTIKITVEAAVAAKTKLNYADLNNAEMNDAELNDADLNDVIWGENIPKSLIELAAKLHGVI